VKSNTRRIINVDKGTARIQSKYKLYEEDMLEPKELKSKINRLSEIGERLEQQNAALHKKVGMNNTASISVEMVKGLSRIGK